MRRAGEDLADAGGTVIVRKADLDLAVTLTAVLVMKLKADPVAQLATLRAAIANLTAERGAVLYAPAATAEMDAQLEAEVAGLAEKGRPSLGSCIGHGVHWPETATADGIVPDAAPMLARLDPERILVRLHAEYARTLAENGNAPGLPTTARKTRVEEIAAATLAVEREQETVVSAMEAAQLAVVRRHDAAPRAIFSIVGPHPRSLREAMTA